MYRNLINFQVETNKYILSWAERTFQSTLIWVNSEQYILIEPAEWKANFQWKRTFSMNKKRILNYFLRKTKHIFDILKIIDISWVSENYQKVCFCWTFWLENKYVFSSATRFLFLTGHYSVEFCLLFWAMTLFFKTHCLVVDIVSRMFFCLVELW